MRNTQDSQPRLQQSWYAREPRFQIIQYTVHYLDLLRFWVGREPRRVWAQTSRKPGQAFQGEVVATVVLDFGPDLQAVVVDHNAAWLESPVTVEFVVEGTAGQIVGDVQQNRLRVRHRTWPQMLWEPALKGHCFPTAFIGSMGGPARGHRHRPAPRGSGRGQVGRRRTGGGPGCGAARGRRWVRRGDPPSMR